jgi:hypothetical protein
MKTDDPRLEESRKRLTERIEKLDNIILTVLKNHVVVEQFMIEFLDACGKKSEELTFAHKITLCEEQHPPEIEKPVWELLKKVTSSATRSRTKSTGRSSDVCRRPSALLARGVALGFRAGSQGTTIELFAEW